MHVFFGSVFPMCITISDNCKPPPPPNNLQPSLSLSPHTHTHTKDVAMNLFIVTTDKEEIESTVLLTNDGFSPDICDAVFHLFF